MSENKELRIAVLGVGMMGAFHVDALSKRIKGARVTVLNDYFVDKAQELADRIGARVVADPIEAINDPEVDAVLIASPGQAHDAQVNACLDAGKPVLCEKPLTTDIASAYAIVQKQAALGNELIQVGFMRRFDAEYVALKTDQRRWSREPAVGALHSSRPSVPDFFDGEYAIRDAVVHEVDITRFLLDEEIVSVQVIAGVATTSGPAGVADPLIVVFETESGRLVTDEVFVRTGVAYEVRTEVVGERGSALSGWTRICRSRPPTGGGVARSPRASSSGSATLTTPSCSAGWTRPWKAPSTALVPGTATRRSRFARPGSRPFAEGTRSP